MLSAKDIQSVHLFLTSRQKKTQIKAGDSMTPTNSLTPTKNEYDPDIPQTKDEYDPDYPQYTTPIQAKSCPQCHTLQLQNERAQKKLKRAYEELKKTRSNWSHAIKRLKSDHHVQITDLRKKLAVLNNTRLKTKLNGVQTPPPKLHVENHAYDT